MSPEREHLEQSLRRRWSLARRQTLIRGAAQLVACVALLVFVDLAIDWSLDLPPAARMGLLAANGLILAVVAYRQLLRHLQPYQPLTEALHEEAEHPELNSLFVSYLQLDPAAAGDAVTAELIRTTHRQAQARAAEHRFAASIRFQQVRRVALVGVGALVVLLVAIAVWPNTFGILARRLFTPHTTAAYPTDTKLAMISGDMVVKQFDPVRAVVQAGGVVPADGELRVRPDGGDWERLVVRGDDTGRFAHQIASASGNFEYRFAIGDARSPVHRVTVVPPPRIGHAAVTLNYPDYTGRRPEPVGELNVEVPEGTQVVWELELDRPIRAASLITADGKTVPVQIDPAGTTLRAALIAEASLSYRYEFDWTLNDQPQQTQSALHFVQVIPDVAPRVAIRYPRASGKATLAKQLSIEFETDDDHAVAAARLIYVLNDGPQRSHDLPLTGDDEGPHQVTLDPRKLAPDLREGDLLSYRIAVTDNRAVADGPQRGVSRTLRLQFVSGDEYLQDVLDRRSRLLGQLRPVYQQQRQAYSNLNALTTPTRAPVPNPTPTTPDRPEEAP